MRRFSLTSIFVLTAATALVVAFLSGDEYRLENMVLFVGTALFVMAAVVGAIAVARDILRRLSGTDATGNARTAGKSKRAQ